MAAEISRRVPTNMLLPRGYKSICIRSNVSSDDFLMSPDEELLDADGGYLHGDFSCPTSPPSRQTLLKFASDVKEGLLLEIEQSLLARTSVSDAAAEVLEQASFVK